MGVGLQRERKTVAGAQKAVQCLLLLGQQLAFRQTLEIDTDQVLTQRRNSRFTRVGDDQNLFELVFHQQPKQCVGLLPQCRRQCLVAKVLKLLAKCPGTEHRHRIARNPVALGFRLHDLDQHGAESRMGVDHFHRMAVQCRPFDLTTGLRVECRQRFLQQCRSRRVPALIELHECGLRRFGTVAAFNRCNFGQPFLDVLERAQRAAVVESGQQGAHALLGAGRGLLALRNQF